MNKIEWDPQLAIDMLAVKKTGRYEPKEPKQARTNVYKNNYEVFSQWGYVTPSGKEVTFSYKQAMLDATKVYREEFNVNDVPALESETTIELVEMGSMECAKQMIDEGLNPAVLNFADAYVACGMYNSGSNAQEESICRVSTLSQTLYQYYNKLWAKKVGVPLRETPAYPMDINYGGIYSKVTVFRDGPATGFAFREEPYDTAVISVAALNLCRQKPGGKTITNYEYKAHGQDALTDEGKVVMKNKMRTIYRIALDNGHNSLVLGAWGCGVFKQRPGQIASMFTQVLNEPEFKNKFREVRFAVLGTKNILGFRQVIEGFDSLQVTGRPALYSFKVGDYPIWGCEYPFDLIEEIGKKKLKRALDFGITHFIDLTEDGELHPYEQYIPKDSGVQHYRFPIKDQNTPKSIEATHALMQQIDAILQDPKAKVYLHCWGGVGRTGTISACWGAYKNHTDYDTTMENLYEWWKTCPKSEWRKIPDHSSQLIFIRKYVEFLKQ